MNIWEYLGIEVTQDERTIKRAYAALLKQCQPEIDPNGFILLRSAYETALKFARDGSFLDTTESEETNFWQTEDSVEEHETPSNLESEKVPVVTNRDQNNNFNLKGSVPHNLQDERSKCEIAQGIFEETKKLLQSDADKSVESKWLLIFQHPDMWDLQVKEIYIELLFDFFSKSDRQTILASKIWLLINQFCLWREREIELYKVYSSDSVDNVLYPIRVALKEQTSLKMKKVNSMRFLSKDVMALRDLDVHSLATEKSRSFLMRVLPLTWCFLVGIKNIILYVCGLIGVFFLIVVLWFFILECL